MEVVAFDCSTVITISARTDISLFKTNPPSPQWNSVLTPSTVVVTNTQPASCPMTVDLIDIATGLPYAGGDLTVAADGVL